MNRYQKIKSYDIDTLAEFIYGIIAETENSMLGKLSALGVEVSLCSLGEDLRIAQIKRDLLEEQDDT
jgi:hypothetical protein